MSLVYLAVGFIIGLFIPSPIDSVIKSWLSAAWNKIKSIFTKQEA